MPSIKHLAAAASLAMLCAGPACAGLIGSTVDVQEVFTDSTGTTRTDVGTYTITGNETVDNGPTINFSDTQIIVTNQPPPGAYTAAAFNGFDLNFLSGISITGANIDSASDPLFSTGAMLSVTGNDLQLNLAGTCGLCNGGEQILIDVQSATPPAGLPEPTSIPLVALGLFGLVAARRRR